MKGRGCRTRPNLFVPFFTTKPGGSGIGLVLCRQIAEAHDGSLKLENRTDTRGRRATTDPAVVEVAADPIRSVAPPSDGHAPRAAPADSMRRTPPALTGSGSRLTSRRRTRRH